MCELCQYQNCFPLGYGRAHDTRREWTHSQPAPGFALCWSVCSAWERTLCCCSEEHPTLLSTGEGCGWGEQASFDLVVTARCPQLQPSHPGHNMIGICIPGYTRVTVHSALSPVGGRAVDRGLRWECR